MHVVFRLPTTHALIYIVVRDYLHKQSVDYVYGLPGGNDIINVNLKLISQSCQKLPRSNGCNAIIIVYQIV